MPSGVYKRKDIWERFWANVRISNNGCWEWTGYKTHQGYGQIHTNGHKVRAHRLLFEHVIKPIPNGFELDHLCRNTSCVNPGHLEIVTHRENVMRGNAPEINRQRQLTKTHCLQGHPYDKQNTYIRLDRDGRECRICRREAYKKWRKRNVL